MDSTAILSATLGLSSPWRIHQVRFAPDGNRLDIVIVYAEAAPHRCPACGRPMATRPGETEVWFHADFLRHPTYLSAETPRLECDCGRVLLPEHPWSRPGSRFARLASPTPRDHPLA